MRPCCICNHGQGWQSTQKCQRISLLCTDGLATHLQVFKVQREVQDVGVGQVLSLQCRKSTPVSLNLLSSGGGTRAKQRGERQNTCITYIFVLSTWADETVAARAHSTTATTAVTCTAPSELSKVMTTIYLRAGWSVAAGPAACWLVSGAATALEIVCEACRGRHSTHGVHVNCIGKS